MLARGVAKRDRVMSKISRELVYTPLNRKRLVSTKLAPR